MDLSLDLPLAYFWLVTLLVDTKARWEKALSRKRLGKASVQETKTSKGRTAFQRDFDRIVFSSAFRRLQDETQVVPFAKNDYVRTRLTHSIEASCIGRSLGQEIGMGLERCLPNDIEPSNVAQIVAAACLAHDIGNPPFGHSGEAAIQLYFSENGSAHIIKLPLKQKKDFEQFDGNAQGFRVLTRLQHPGNPGLQLSCATLAAFTKYPNGSLAGNHKKIGFFQSEVEFVDEMAREVGLIQKAPGIYHRHPLAFLVEAADDICYRIMDFEDAFRLHHLRIDEVREHLGAIVGDKIKNALSEEDEVAILRAKAIDKIISQIASWFVKNQQDILFGRFEGSLIEQVECSEELKEIKEISREKYYSAREVLEIEVPAFDVLSGLLSDFITAVNDVSRNKNPREKSKELLRLLPRQFLEEDGKPDKDEYQRLLKITDFVSGMSDSYAVSLYRQIKGLSLPGV